MKICIPVNEDQGLQSTVCAHFGSAPLFMLVDTDTGHCRAIINQNQHHGHGMCQPLQALQSEKFACLVVGGIGMGAVNKLRAGGISVYLSEHGTVEQTVTALQSGTLRPVDPQMACAHHGHGGQH